MIPCMGLPAFDLCSQLTISEIIESLIAEYSRSGMDLNELLNQWPASSFGATGFSPRFKCGKKFKEASEDDFVIKVDCRHFEASELSLTLSDGNIVVVGKHDEKAEGNGFVKREFTRRYPIPGEVEIEELSSSLSDCGVLTIKAPKKRS
ncbi:alpha-crystallin A chain-like protein, partial [Dinothrombium tinctorium]